jgi:UDP-4-amino-4,6-dideoxy-N-acetyl-beta-L-altrosamine transaminase
VGAAEATAVAAAVRDAWLTGGATLARFEARLAEVAGVRHAIAVSSGTAALHTAYLAAGVGPGDTVLTTPITFVATANAAVLCGAVPRFADTDDCASLDPAAVGAAVCAGMRPRVVVPVHYAGHPAPVAAIAAAAPGALVVEDACHALGSTDGTTPIGACRDAAMAVFSFHAVKTITTGEGGAVVTNDAQLAARCRRLRDHGLVRDPAALDAADGPWSYEQHEIGLNYRLTDIQAALGLVQLDRLDAFVARRQAIARRYDRLVAAMPRVTPVSPPAGTRSAYHLYAVRVPAAQRRAVFEGLRARGIGVQVHYIPVHLQPWYRRHLGTGPGDCPRAEQFYREVLSLPCFPDMTDDDVVRVVTALGELVGTAREASAPREEREHVHPAW